MTAEPRDKGPEIEAKNGRVLIVDDDERNRRLLKDVLSVKGYGVVEAVDGEDALRRAFELTPDVVLLDVMMPKLDGFAVCRKLKADSTTRATPVLMVTSLRDRVDRVNGVEAGADDFISKPIDTEEVALRVRNAVRMKRLLDRARRDLEELKKLEQLRDDLTHMIVHDMRSPLTGIKGILDLLKLDAPAKLDDEDIGLLNEALSGTSTLIEMISSLLDVSRLESGQMPLNKTDTDLGDVVDEAVASLGGLAANRITRHERPTERVSANCDPEIIRRVFENLVANALKFTPESGEVIVRLLWNGGVPRCEVEDSGRGIPAEYHEKIFHKFGQVAVQKELKRFSTGLGLAYCKLAVEAHGGTIGVESGEGTGSTFWFELPEQEGL